MSSHDDTSSTSPPPVRQPASRRASAGLGEQALHWLSAGATLAALRTGARVAGQVVRRNPWLVGAAVVGAGVLWYAVRQRARRQAVLEGQSRQVRALRRDEYERDEYGV